MPGNEQLAEQLRSRGRELSRWVIDDMYRNPFWASRFASRGKEHAAQDAQYHITYLATAVETGLPEIMANYAVWLRNVLTSRGMCTRHLDENFERLADAMAMDYALSPDRLPFACLEAARTALLYEEGTARHIQQRQQQLADTILKDIGAHPKFENVPGISTRDDVRYLLSFCADGVASNSSDQLAAHLSWMHRFSNEQQVDDRLPELVFSTTTLTLETTFPQDDSPAFRQVLDVLVAEREHST